MYINYETEEDAKKKIRKFAIRNANAIIAQFQQCTDVAAKHIGEHALAALRKTEDFKFICAKYD